MYYQPTATQKMPKNIAHATTHIVKMNSEHNWVRNYPNKITDVFPGMKIKTHLRSLNIPQYKLSA